MIRLAYLSDWDFSEFPARDAAKLTHVNYSFAVIKDGKASVAHWKQDAKIRELIKSHPKLKVSLALGGWGAGGFSEAMETPKTRETLAESLIPIIKEYGFCGVDLDWEYPSDNSAGIAASPKDSERYPFFVRLLRRKLDKLGEETGLEYLLTMAVGAGEKFARALRFVEMIDCLNYVNLMSYDMGIVGKDCADHHTNLFMAKGGKMSADTASESLLKYGVPPEKIVLGVAFYGRSCRVTERGDRNGLFMPQVSGSESGYRRTQLKEHLERGAELFWDEAAKAPYLYNDKEKFFATFDNERSIAEKIKFAKSRGFGGIMFWEYNNDKDGILLEALFKSCLTP